MDDERLKNLGGGGQLLLGNGSVSHKQAVDKATEEYKKYKAKTLSDVEQDYFNSIKMLEQKTEKNNMIGWMSIWNVPKAIGNSLETELVNGRFIETTCERIYSVIEQF